MRKTKYIKISKQKKEIIRNDIKIVLILEIFKERKKEYFLTIKEGNKDDFIYSTVTLRKFYIKPSIKNFQFLSLRPGLIFFSMNKEVLFIYEKLPISGTELEICLKKKEKKCLINFPKFKKRFCIELKRAKLLSIPQKLKK